MADIDVYDIISGIAKRSINDRIGAIDTINYSTSVPLSDDNIHISSDSDERWFLFGISEWGSSNSIVSE